MNNGAKNYVYAKQNEFDSAEARRTLIAEEWENYLQKKGLSYTWEQVKSMALDKSKRYGQWVGNSRLATIEIIEANDWDELQREGLGMEFLAELEEFYFSLLRNPHSLF